MGCSPASVSIGVDDELAQGQKAGSVAINPAVLPSGNQTWLDRRIPHLWEDVPAWFF
jgi:hypothetical protein